MLRGSVRSSMTALQKAKQSYRNTTKSARRRARVVGKNARKMARGVRKTIHDATSKGRK